MKKNFLRLLSFAIISAVIVSCGGESNPLIKEAKIGLESQNYDAALLSLDQAIDLDSVNAQAYYYKGLVYSEMAQNNPQVSNRKDSYRKMRENLLIANNLFTQQGAKSLEAVESNLLIDRIWGKEHNMGVRYATGDTTLPKTDKPFELSEAHLENATVINPDSTLSYDVLAEVYRIDGKPEEGIRVYQTIMDLKNPPEAFDYDRLGSLYLQTSQFDKAVDILNEGIAQYPDSISLVQKLADAYMNDGNNEKSIETIESLLETDPNNPQYHLVLGTQVYIMASKINEDISAKYDQIFNIERNLRNLSSAERKDAENRLKSMRSEINQQTLRSDELTDRAINEIVIVTEMRPDDASANNTLGIIYQNKAAALFDKRNATSDNDEASKIDAEAKDNLRLSMKYYEKATEIEPDNQSYWRALFQVYTSLGMNDKAEAAMEKAGM